MKYYIIAGEASGDLHGANLIRGLLAADPQAEFRFWGGDQMVKTATGSGTLAQHYKEGALMGFWEVFRSLRKILRRMSFCREDILQFQPDALILIDYPGFNLRMARFAHEQCKKGKLDAKVFYYIAPKVWAWKEFRVKQLKAFVDQLFIILPFEVEYFRRHGIEAFYTGNPIVDSVAERLHGVGTEESHSRFLSENGLEHKPIIALVAGSRVSEIQHNLPAMVEVSKHFPDYQFVVTGVSWLDKSLYDKYLKGSNVQFVCDKTYDLIAHSTAALVTSGTATLETALLGVPEVVCFRGSSISMSIARKMVNVPFISLVNLIMNREVVRELIQGDFTPEKASHELRLILPGGEKYNQLERDYVMLRERMGKPGVSQRVAQEMINQLGKQ